MFPSFIFFIPGVALVAQETDSREPPAYSRTAIDDSAIQTLRGSVTAIDIGVATNIGGMFLVTGGFASSTFALILASIVATPGGHTTTIAAYSTLQGNCNRLFPDEKQNMLPYPSLTLGGMSVSAAGFLAYLDSLSGQGSFTLSGYLIAEIGGLPAHISCMTVASVYGETLLAMVNARRAAGSAAGLSTAVVLAVYPEIGLNYWGVKVSVPD